MRVPGARNTTALPLSQPALVVAPDPMGNIGTSVLTPAARVATPARTWRPAQYRRIKSWWWKRLTQSLRQPSIPVRHYFLFFVCIAGRILIDNIMFKNRRSYLNTSPHIISLIHMYTCGNISRSTDNWVMITSRVLSIIDVIVYPNDWWLYERLLSLRRFRFNKELLSTSDTCIVHSCSKSTVVLQQALSLQLLKDWSTCDPCCDYRVRLGWNFEGGSDRPSVVRIPSK